jgi:hypothetical protein
MSFQDKLKRLKEKEQQEVLARERAETERIKQEQRQEELRKKQAEDNFNYLKRIVSERFQPIIDVINQSYLDGQGSVSISRVGHLEKPGVMIGLTWDDWSTSDSQGGKLLGIEMNQQAYRVIAGRQYVAQVPVNDRKWQNKIEEALYSSLELKQFEWSTYWNSGYP